MRGRPLPFFILHLSSFILIVVLAGCGSVAQREHIPPPPSTVSKAPPATTPRPGAYYLDDGPGDNPPSNLDSIPDAIPRAEPLHRGAARPYTVMGRSYTPMTALAPYKARGLATWYGRRYHGKPTSSGEPYDMYAMSAAHATLPLPSYARVTHLGSGKSVVVRVNDCGPFHDGRIIDLSYTAALKLGILGGATMVEVESIIPDGAGSITAKAPAQTPPPQAAAQVPVISQDGRIFLQLGAFGSRENAEGYLSRLKAQADWLALQVFSGDGLYRVQAGPYADQTEARQIADRLTQALGIKAMVLTR